MHWHPYYTFTNNPAVTFVKTGTGGIDPGEGLRRGTYKPTGLLERPARKRSATPSVDERARQTGEIAADIA